jgi:2-amino-4-hydroxy-6-hydroxymethyldihydropteridine diphosphokinase
MPFGVTSQPPFMNAVARIETAMSAEALMRALHMLERKAGRRRRKRWGPRTLDLDLLDYHSLIRRPARSSIKPLALPHPGLEQRIFVLAPLLEVAPRWRHPVSHQLAALTLRKLYRLEQS